MSRLSHLRGWSNKALQTSASCQSSTAVNRPEHWAVKGKCLFSYILCSIKSLGLLKWFYTYPLAVLFIPTLTRIQPRFNYYTKWFAPLYKMSYSFTHLSKPRQYEIKNITQASKWQHSKPDSLD